MIKTENFTRELQELAALAKTLSHPARLMILQYLAEQKVCMSGDISNEIPLSRTTVSQHLKELKSAGLIHGSIEGLTVNYCLKPEAIKLLRKSFDSYLNNIDLDEPQCC
jgi:ArsR family transcriptional regulator